MFTSILALIPALVKIGSILVGSPCKHYKIRMTLMGPEYGNIFAKYVDFCKEQHIFDIWLIVVIPV